MSGPLSGLRVIDCTSGMAGPRATGIMSDYGADVLWVERPGGDPWRAELAEAYSTYNRGKRSAIIDLAEEQGRQQLLDLLGGADVFVHSWRPGVADRLGLGVDEMRRRLPHLVYAEISGFGPGGPLRDEPGYEAIVHALLGTMGEQSGWRDGPIFEALPFAGLGASSLTVIGILAALYRREDDGVGRHVETSMMDGALAYLAMFWNDTDDPIPRLRTGAMVNRLIVGSFECSDGEWLGLHTGAVGAFGRCMRAFGLEDRVPPSDDGLDMALPATPEELQILRVEVPALLATQPRAVWLERLLAADVCTIPALRPTEVFDEPQARHNQIVVTVDDPVLGPVQQVGPTAIFSRTPGAVTDPAPTAGQHTAEVLAETASAPPRHFPDVSAVQNDRPLLDGVRILDFGAYFAGPYAARLLGDLGAEVVKLETLAGDPLRGSERSFAAAHANKRSIAADLKRPEGQAIGRRLAAWADVAMHNMRPGVAERLGLGYDQLLTDNPSLIYAHSPGWGSTGPDRARQGFAPMYSGYVGASFEVAGVGNPPAMPLGNEDPGNGLLGAMGILMALLHRRRTGEGQLLEHPQLNATMGHLDYIVRRPDGEVLGAGRLDSEQMGTGPYNRLYRTSDGWICVVAATLDQRRQLRRVLDVTEDADPLRQSSRLAAAISERSTVTLGAALDAAGLPWAVPVPQNFEDFLRDPENHRSGRVAESPHPTRGRTREVAKMVRVSNAASPPHRRFPRLGEHTVEILTALGYSPDEVDELRSTRVVKSL